MDRVDLWYHLKPCRYRPEVLRPRIVFYDKIIDNRVKWFNPISLDLDYSIGSDKMIKLGLDIGTKNIVLAYQKEGKVRVKHEVNGFIKIPNTDNITKQLLDGGQVAYVERNGEFVALGKKAEDLAYAFNKTLYRPMSDGVINGSAEESMEIMAVIIHSIIGELEDDAILYYCIPADALNMKTNVAFHDKIIQMIMKQYSGKKLDSFSINEARALAIGQIPDKTGVAISMGAGMVNVSYTLYGIGIFEFSIIGSGDKIDLDTAMKFGFDPNNPNGSYKETPTSVCRRKEGRIKNMPFSLRECPNDIVGKAIYINYHLMIDSVVRGIIDGFNAHSEKARIDRPIPIVFGGGTAMAEGLVDLAKEVFGKYDLPFEISGFRLAERPLYAVAEGCLAAATLHQ